MGEACIGRGMQHQRCKFVDSVCARPQPLSPSAGCCSMGHAAARMRAKEEYGAAVPAAVCAASLSHQLKHPIYPSAGCCSTGCAGTRSDAGPQVDQTRALSPVGACWPRSQTGHVLRHGGCIEGQMSQVLPGHGSSCFSCWVLQAPWHPHAKKCLPDTAQAVWHAA